MYLCRNLGLNQIHGDICLKAWKKGDHPMGDDVRPYCAEAPATTDGSEVNLADFSFKLVQVSVDNRKSGWSKYTFKLSQTVRAMYQNDIVYGSDWRALIKDFDDRFLDLLFYLSGKMWKGILSYLEGIST